MADNIIFTHTDDACDTLAFRGHPFEESDVIAEINDDHPVLLSPAAVTRLREALRPYDPEPGADDDDIAEAYERGCRDTVASFDLVTREEVQSAYLKGHSTASNEQRHLNPERVAALEKATEIAVQLRSAGPLGMSGSVTAEQVVGLAMFLLNELPMPAAK